MDQASGTDIFGVQETLNQQHFIDPVVQSVYNKILEMNSNIQLRFEARSAWKKRNKNIWGKDHQGKNILFIPNDLHIWEMIDVIQDIELHTHTNNPGTSSKSKEKMLKLGNLFKNTGIYIAARLNGITNGKKIAETLAIKFYQYGQLITEGISQNTLQIDDIASIKLNPEDTETIDHFLAGDALYTARKKRIERLPQKDENLYENVRQQTLAQFFRTAEKAFLLQSRNTPKETKESNTKLKPWQIHSPIHSTFLTTIQNKLRKTINSPRDELIMLMLKRGLKHLTKEVKKPNNKYDNLINYLDRFGISLQKAKKSLFETLKITQLREELDRVRKGGNNSLIAIKEKQIADIIHDSISTFPYNIDANNPKAIATNKEINCLGASFLGGTLMKEAGLNILLCDVNNHSVLLLVTQDGKIEWRDMQSTFYNMQLTNEMIQHIKKDGNLTIQDLVSFSTDPNMYNLNLKIIKRNIKSMLHWIIKDSEQDMYLYKFEEGFYDKIMYIIAFNYIKSERYTEALETVKLAIEINSNNPKSYTLLGGTLYELNRYEEAVEAYKQAIEIDSNNPELYERLGRTLYELNRYEEAVEAYKQAIAINPNIASYHNDLGNCLKILNKAEAIQEYSKAIELDLNYPFPYNGLGNYYRDSDQYEKAIEAYTKAIQLNQEYANPYFSLGKIYSSLNNKEKAIQMYEFFIKYAMNDSRIDSIKLEIKRLKKPT